MGDWLLLKGIVLTLVIVAVACWLAVFVLPEEKDDQGSWRSPKSR